MRDVTLRRCRPDDLDALRAIALRTYDEAFRPLNTDAVMEAYLSHAFDRARVEEELDDRDSRFFFLYVAGDLAGYLKLNAGKAQTDPRGDDALEIERIYVDRPFQGRGLGAVLVGKAFEVAREEGKRTVWLGVWEKNTGAIRFYERMGFTRSGTHVFLMGKERQNDFIMSRSVPPG